MSSQDQKDDRSTTDAILDLLLDALAERQRSRRIQRDAPASPPPAAATWKPPASVETPAAVAPRDEGVTPSSAAPVPTPRPEPPAAEVRRPSPVPQRPVAPPPRLREPEPGDEGWEPPPRLPSISMGKMLWRLALLVGVLLVAVNIPVNQYGVSLARIMPESSSLIIRDGLVLKGSGPEFYMLEENRLRWISSLDAFEHLGLTWGDVRVVEDSFLERFEDGRPIHVLLKCGSSDHIYRLENQEKRWIKDIDTFLAEGHVWEDVRFVSCDYLRDLPTGPSIPEDAGPAPEP
jgi:hypothetical protein